METTKMQNDLILASNLSVDRYNFNQEIVNEIKSYKGFKVSDFKNTDEIDELNSKLKTARDYRLAIEEQRKSLKQPYLDAGRKIDEIAKELQKETSVVEAELKAEKDRIQKLQEEEEQRIEKELQERLHNRVAQLKEMGIQFDGEFYSIGEISIDVGTIKQIDEDKYQVLLAKVQLAKKKIDEENAKRLAKEKAEAEAREAERKAIEAEKKAMEEERLALEKQRKQIEEQRIKQMLTNAMYFLKSLGFEEEGNTFILKGKILSSTWNKMELISTLKKLDNLDEFQKIIENELNEMRQEDEKRFAESKRLAEIRLKEEEEEKKKKEQERKEMLPDIEKIKLFSSELTSLMSKKPKLKNSDLSDKFSKFEKEINDSLSKLMNEIILD